MTTVLASLDPTQWRNYQNIRPSVTRQNFAPLMWNLHYRLTFSFTVCTHVGPTLIAAVLLVCPTLITTVLLVCLTLIIIFVTQTNCLLYYLILSLHLSTPLCKLQENNAIFHKFSDKNLNGRWPNSLVQQLFFKGL